MKITKELMEHLNISSITFKNDNKDVLCFFEKVDKGMWTFYIPQQVNLSLNQKVYFQVTFYEYEKSCGFFSEVSKYDNNHFTVIPETNTDDPNLYIFFNEIIEMEKKYNTFGRRKEERIKIGKDNAKEFGLSSIQQVIFLQGIKMMQPCVVLDVSVHGICVITPETSAIKDEENFCIKISFSNPTNTIILKAHRVYTRVNKTEQKSYLTLSCQLLEPIHFKWRERVISMIERNSLLKFTLEKS